MKSPVSQELTGLKYHINEVLVLVTVTISLFESMDVDQDQRC
jgi:hypothetical protein